MYSGRVYQAGSGQWSWGIEKDGIEIVGGAGYPSEEEAKLDMEVELQQYQDREQ